MYGQQHTNIPMNQRLWNIAKHNPKKCSYCKAVKVVYLKTVTGSTLACVAFKVRERKSGIEILDEEGMICLQGERVGWPVHRCAMNPNSKNKKVETIDEVPPPEFEPEDNEQLSINN
jgi:hypothetical protein